MVSPATATDRGHLLVNDPPHGLSRMRRETCSVCGRARLTRPDGSTYGSATEVDCEPQPPRVADVAPRDHTSKAFLHEVARRQEAEARIGTSAERPGDRALVREYAEESFRMAQGLDQ